MGSEERRNRKKYLRFNETEIKMALSVLKKLDKPMELLYYLMKREDERPFVVMLISADTVALEKLLKNEKRDTDLLFEINKDESLYALICQETKIDGGYRFAERLLRTLKSEDAKNIYSVELEVGSSRYEIKEVIFRLIKIYIDAKQNEEKGEIIFHSLA